MDRRSFFRALGLAPVLVPTVVIAASRKVDEDLAPKITDMIKMSHREPFRSLPGNNVFSYYPGVSKGDVTLGVGEDTRLWVKSSTDKEWKRLAIEEKILL